MANAASNYSPASEEWRSENIVPVATAYQIQMRRLPNEGRADDNDSMETPITRPELDAKLGTIEAKMDGRLARIEDGFSGLERRFDKLETVLEKQKYTAWAAAGATIVAVSGIVFAAYSMGFGAFDSGRETARLAADAQTKALQAQQETAAALTQIRQIVSDLKAAQPQHK